MGIEVVEEAVEDARLNAERNGVKDCLFVAGKAEDELLSLRDEDFDLVVVDPPQPGPSQKCVSSTWSNETGSYTVCIV